MKTLIVITREIRAERPDEATILADSIAVNSGQAPTQSPTTDDFFVVSGDPVKHAVRLLSINDDNPYGRTSGDGVAFYPYPHDGTGATSVLRTWEGMDENEETITIAKAHVQHSGGTEIYDTLEEARTFIEGLDASEGYVLIDEGKDTQVIESRPSLIPSELDISYDVDLSVKATHPTRLSNNDRY